MPSSDGVVQDTPVVHRALAPYLQAVAVALAASDATPESVLQAAYATGIDRGGSTAHFHSPDQRFRDAFVTFVPSVDGGAPRLKSVLFVCDRARAPVPLAEAEQAFGTWKRGIPGSSVDDVYPIVFDAPYPPAAVAARPPRIATVVRLSLTAAPTTRETPVREILLSRFHLDP